MWPKFCSWSTNSFLSRTTRFGLPCHLLFLIPCQTPWFPQGFRSQRSFPGQRGIIAMWPEFGLKLEHQIFCSWRTNSSGFWLIEVWTVRSLGFFVPLPLARPFGPCAWHGSQRLWLLCCPERGSLPHGLSFAVGGPIFQASGTRRSEPRGDLFFLFPCHCENPRVPCLAQRLGELKLTSASCCGILRGDAQQVALVFLVVGFCPGTVVDSCFCSQICSCSCAHSQCCCFCH